MHFLAVHETQLAIYETTKLERLKQWIPYESLFAPISNATYSCDSLPMQAFVMVLLEFSMLTRLSYGA